jgi:hypothetical protein
MYGFNVQIRDSFDKRSPPIRTSACCCHALTRTFHGPRPSGALKRAQFRSRRNCVVVREEADGKVTVGFMDPIAVLRLTDNPAIGELAKEVRGKLERVRDRLSG